MHPFRLAIPSLALALVVVGCGEADVVSRSEVERQTREGLTKSVGQQAPPAKCPETLKAEVGATTRCTMDFPERKRLGITVKIVEVNGDRVQFAIEADQQLTEIQ
jgi:hypothetical protein